MSPHRSKLSLAWVLFVAVAAAAQVAQTASDPSILTLDRIFSSAEFQSKGIGGFRWLKSGEAYSKIEPSATVKGGSDLVCSNQ